MINVSINTIYQMLDFNARSWWAHADLRKCGKVIEARKAERQSIKNDLETVRKAQYILVSNGRWVIVTGRHSNVSGYGWLNDPLILACILRGVPCVDYSEIDRETGIILPVPGPDFPARTGRIGMLDDVSFSVHAAISKFAGATLYNIGNAGIDRYVVSRDGSGWMVIDTESEKIDEAKAWLIAKAITASHDGWDGDMWMGEKWLPITFWTDDLKDERELAALIYTWYNDGFDGNGSSRFTFGGEQWLVEISENMGLDNISRVVKKKIARVPRSYFWRRVDKVVAAILADRRDYGRSLDESFENHDGSQIVTAVIRRARKNPRLDELIRKRWSPSGGWHKEAALRDELTQKELEAEADMVRKIEKAVWDLTFYNPEYVFLYGAGVHLTPDGHRIVDALHDYQNCETCLVAVSV